MKKNYFLLSVMLISSLFYYGCNKDELSSLKMVIEGTVYDNQKTTVLEGVTVSLTTDGKTETATTDANGFYSLKSFPSGNYTVVFTKPGYLKTSSVVSSEDLATTANTDKLVVNSHVYLNPLSESISITAFLNYSSADVSLVAANVDYTALVNSYFSFSGTTDENGLITHDSLPYSSFVYFYFDFTVDDIHYKDNESIYTTNYDQTMEIDGYDPNGNLGVVNSNITTSYGDGIKDFPVDGDIVLNFTQPIDTNDYSLTMYSYNAGGNVVLTKTWSKSNMTVTLAPDTDLTAGTQYRLYLNVYNDTRGQSFSDYIYFYAK